MKHLLTKLCSSIEACRFGHIPRALCALVSFVMSTVAAGSNNLDCVGQGPAGPNPARPPSEIALANMIIYSQEYIKDFFADDDSAVQPLPASGMSLFAAFGVEQRSRWLAALTIPLREEEVKKKIGEPFRYYYPKLFMAGFEMDWLNQSLFDGDSCFRVSTSLGAAVPLSQRFLRYFPPFLLTRAAVRIAPNVDLNFGFGYSGNIEIGAWFFPFGITYRIAARESEKKSND